MREKLGADNVAGSTGFSIAFWNCVNNPVPPRKSTAEQEVLEVLGTVVFHYLVIKCAHIPLQVYVSLITIHSSQS
jgi:hypothetical protein